MGADWARPVVLWGLTARDPEALADFYRRVANWEISPGPFMQVSPGLGGPEPGPGGLILRGDRPGFSLYVQVADLPASLALVAELGGRAVTGPIDQPGGATFALAEDPEGNPIGLVQQ
ncbi:MAG TPA: VOC family protein [Acidimicrobiales bacterium]|nr:VOC family protein [Acidimicrobiales bacterium]